MNYYQKYLKYQKKYQNLIGGTFGEVINIPTLESVKDNTFLNNYREIPNSGQKNCGIFISDIYKDKLIKCGSYLHTIEPVLKLQQSHPKYYNLNIFPKLYQYYKYQDKNYIEMERLDGDTTELLYEILPRKILDNMPISKEEQDNIYDFYFLFVPNTMNSKIPYYDDLILYFLNNPNGYPDIIEDYIKMVNESYDSIKITDSNDIEYEFSNQFKYHSSLQEDETIRKYVYDSQVKSFDVLSFLGKIKPFEKSNYFKFLEIFEPQFKLLFNFIRKQIIMLELILISIGFNYIDIKLDNFGFKLSEELKPHLGILWEEGKEIFGVYIYIYIIDWDSGLFPFDDSYNENPLKNFIKSFNNFSKYGQHGHTIISECNLKLEKFDKRFEPYVNIIKSIFPTSGTWQTTEFKTENIDFSTLKDLLAMILDNNELNVETIDTIVSRDVDLHLAKLNQERIEREKKYARK